MVFRSRFILSNGTPPGRVYLHTAGLHEVFNNGDCEVVAQKYLLRVLHDQRFILKEFEFYLGLIWGNIKEKTKVIDFFGYKNIGEWPGNPDVVPFVVKNGFCFLNEPSTCEDSIIMLGKEGEYRRTLPDLK